MRASCDRLLRTVDAAWLGATSYGLFAADGASVRRWVVAGTPQERARWCALFRRGISIADLLLLEPRWRRRDMRALLRSWLHSGWLDGAVLPAEPADGGAGSAPAGEPAPAPGGVITFGDAPALRLLLPGTSHRPRQGGSTAWMRSLLAAAAPRLVIYDAQAMQWSGLSVLHRQVVGRVDLLALFRLGGCFAAVALPAGSEACLGCAERWLIGSSPFPREIGAWLQGLITEATGQVEPLPLPWARELADLAAGLGHGQAGTASVTVATSGEPPQRARLRQHPSCPGRHRPPPLPARPGSAAPAAVAPLPAVPPRAPGEERTSGVLARCLSELAGPAGLFRGLQVEDVGEPGGPSYYFARAAFNTGFRTHHGDPVHCFGDGEDAALASLRCAAECLERFCTFHFDSRSWRRATWAELGDHAVAPPSLTLYSEAQYQTQGFPFPRFDPHRPGDWLRGHALASGREVWVPAELVFVGYSAPAALTIETSAGAATQQSFEAAAAAGLLEVLERDALAVTFLAGHAPPRLSLPAEGETSDRVRLMRDSGYQVVALDLTLDLEISVVLVLALRPGGPGPLLLKGAGSSFRRERALAQAMRELWRSFLYYRRHPEAATVARSAHPWSLEYGLAYYQRPEALATLRFLLQGPEAPASASTAEPDTLPRLVEACARAQLEPIAVDCTLPMLREVGLHCVRVLVPGLQPLSVGEAPWRLGGQRVLDLPRRLGWRDRPLTEGELHRAPHFFT